MDWTIEIKSYLPHQRQFSLHLGALTVLYIIKNKDGNIHKSEVIKLERRTNEQ